VQWVEFPTIIIIIIITIFLLNRDFMLNLIVWEGGSAFVAGELWKMKIVRITMVRITMV
jgi:hypothetical protein